MTDKASLFNDTLGELDQRLGVHYVEATMHKVVARMPVEGNRQPMGLLHGGATIALCESVASVAAFLHAETMGQVSVGLDVNATHHRSATSGYVTATATPIKVGRSITSHEVAVHDDQGHRVCTARVTCFVK